MNALARTAARSLASAVLAVTAVAASTGQAHAGTAQPSAPLPVGAGIEQIVDIGTPLASTPVLRVARTGPSRDGALAGRQRARRAARL